MPISPDILQQILQSGTEMTEMAEGKDGGVMVVLGIVLFTIALGASIGGAVALNSLEKALSKAISKLPKR